MNRWLEWTRRLQLVFQTGLAYARDPFDRERYEQLRELTAEILAAHSADPAADFARVLAAESGYPTPKIDIRAVVVRDGAVLLVQEQDDGGYCLPGGWADVGRSAREVVEKEVFEETGLHTRATRLLAVLDEAKHDHPPQLWYVYKLVFACEILGGELRPSAIEGLHVDFFPRDRLPEPLSVKRTTRAQIVRMLDLLDTPGAPTEFD